MSNRAFGVEIECYSPDGEPDYYGDPGDGVDCTYNLLTRHKFSSWANLCARDDSLYGENGGYGVEVKSPVLQGEEGLEEVTKVLKILSDSGYWVEEDCGLHVHVDAPEFMESNPLVIKAVKAWVRNQHLVNNMVADWRLENDHCEQWTEEDIKELERTISDNSPLHYSLRGAINVGSMSHHGTIEIRQHESTLDPEEVISWIQFCQAFIDEIAGGTLRKMNSEELLLRRLKVERNASRFLSTKARRNKEQRANR